MAIFTLRWKRRLSPGRHRADFPIDSSAHRYTFKPKHCAGTSCFHDHHGEPPVWRNFHGAVS